MIINLFLKKIVKICGIMSKPLKSYEWNKIISVFHGDDLSVDRLHDFKIIRNDYVGNDRIIKSFVNCYLNFLKKVIEDDDEKLLDKAIKMRILDLSKTHYFGGDWEEFMCVHLFEYANECKSNKCAKKLKKVYKIDDEMKQILEQQKKIFYDDSHKKSNKIVDIDII